MRASSNEDEVDVDDERGNDDGGLRHLKRKLLVQIALPLAGKARAGTTVFPHNDISSIRYLPIIKVIDSRYFKVI